MAFRLGDYVVYGELYNKSNYSTHGNIALRGVTPGEETVLHVELTGNCGKDLRGRHFRFTPAEGADDSPVYHPEDHPNFQMGQIGPTGEMTAQGWVKVMPCSVEEFMRRADLGEAPPTEWKRRLYLEWYGQNGRIVIEMADPAVEECVREPKCGGDADDEDEGDWVPLPNLALPPDLDETHHGAGPGITMISHDEDGTHIEHHVPSEPEAEDDDPSQDTPLQRHLDAESAAIDRALHFSSYDDGSEEDAVREMELMDDCIGHRQTQPLFLLLEDTAKLPPEEELDDAQAEAALKGLLTQLAMVGVALDVCEHFTPRDCYRLIRDKLLLEPNAYPELVGSGWVQHVSTWEYCKECEAEGETNYGEFDDSGDSMDCPF